MTRTMPLKLIEDISQPFNLWSQIKEWLHQKTRLLLFYQMPAQEKDLIEQLKKRKNFPEHEWENFGVKNLEILKRFLKDFGSSTTWPNYFFIPDDPLGCVIYSGPVYNDLNVWLARFIKDYYGIDFSAEKISEFAASGYTLGDLLKKLQ